MFATQPFASIHSSPEQAADAVLRQYWNGQYPVDPVLIAQSMGLTVGLLNPFTEHGLSGRFDAVQRYIGVSSTEAPVRQRFTTAHEIGHYVLNHGSNFRDAPSSFSSGISDPKEREANQFAAALLMPAEAVRQVIASGRFRLVEEIANLFGVSKVAMSYRISNLNLSLFL